MVVASLFHKYDKVRPSYPSTTLQLFYKVITAQVETSVGLAILEVGSGPGIFSRVLLSPPSLDYPQYKISSLVGIEPEAGMRSVETSQMDSLPSVLLEGRDIRTVEGTFEDFSKAGIQPKTVDAIVIAQAWHWCTIHSAAFVGHPPVSVRSLAHVV